MTTLNLRFDAHESWAGRVRRPLIAGLGMAVLTLAVAGTLVAGAFRVESSPLALPRVAGVWALTHDGDFVAWSANSRWILYDSLRLASSYASESLWVVHPNGQGRKLLARNSVDAAFASDGRSVVYLACIGGRLCPHHKLMEVHPNNLRRKVFAGLADPYAATESIGSVQRATLPHDGLAVQRGDRLYDLNLGTGRTERLGRVRVFPRGKTLYTGGANFDESISPTGKYIALMTDKTGLVVRDVATGRLISSKLVPAGAAYDESSIWAWSADGNILTYGVSRPRGSRSQQVLVTYDRAFDVRSRAVWTISHSAWTSSRITSASGFHWSPGDRWTVFGLGLGGDGNWVGLPHPALVERYGTSKSYALTKVLDAADGYGPNQSAQWSPSGSYIAYDAPVAHHAAVQSVWVAKMGYGG